MRREVLAQRGLPHRRAGLPGGHRRWPRSVLVDVRGVSGRIPTILDRFDLGVHLAELHLEHTPRIRIALLGHEPMIHPDRFGEIVARNRGADARAFTVESDALDWLTAV